MAALAAPEEVRGHLIGATAAGAPITYSELLERLGYPFSRPRMRQLCVLLGEVDAIGAARGEPPLAVLVVRQSDGLPGRAGGSARPATMAIAAPGKGRKRAHSSIRCSGRVFHIGAKTGRFASGPPVNHLCSPIGGQLEA